MGFEAGYEEAEIGCGEWGGWVRKVAGVEEVADIDSVEESVHFKRSDGALERKGFRGVNTVG